MSGHRLEKDLIQEAKGLASEAGIKTMITFTTIGRASPMKVLVDEGAKDLDANLGHDVFFLTYNPITTTAFDDHSETFKAREGNKGDMSAIYDLLKELTVIEDMDHVFVASREEFCAASGVSDLFQTVVVEHCPPERPPEIIGCAIISKFYNYLKGTVHYIQGLYIRPNYRGKGRKRGKKHVSSWPRLTPA
ncbi:uncharacterized protein [Diadema antillarum]|uniref:uncharacterized protein n=1 Tax=Diadema antillarum TaxID=105358 RepID=UPI003A88301F